MHTRTKTVAVFRHNLTEGAGYFGQYLDQHQIPWTMIQLDQGQAVPTDPELFSGLVFMGGPMSVNDDLVWIQPVIELIRSAMAKGIPTLGHCLGGQLICKAMGGEVTANPVKEIGCWPITVADTLTARSWFGDDPSFLSFHWHNETFSLPPGADWLASSEHCVNQAFAKGPHLAMQCHIEITEEMVALWCQDWSQEVEDRSTVLTGIQTPQDMQQYVDTKVQNLHQVADRVYDRWVKCLQGVVHY